MIVPLRRGIRHWSKVITSWRQIFGQRRSIVIMPFVLSTVMILPSFPLVNSTKTVDVPVSLVLTKDDHVLADSAGQIKIVPGESNTTLAEKARRIQAETSWQSYLNTSKVKIPVLSYDQMLVRIEQFLQRQGSPMVSSASDLLDITAQYSLDPRLLIGIAGAESSFGLAMPSGSHNPFGLGPTQRFKSFADGYAAEAAFLQQYFTSRRIFSPLQIGPSYTGTGSQTWGPSVLNFMSQI